VRSMTARPMTSRSSGEQGAQPPRAPLERQMAPGAVHGTLAVDPKSLQLFGPPSAGAKGGTEKLLNEDPASGLLEVVT